MRHQVSAVLLAAGSSKRMGRQKQLLPLGERTVIEQCVSTIIDSGVRDVVVVLGPDADDISNAIRLLPVRTVLNDQPESEMAESMRAGLKAVLPEATGVLVCLADHPLVTAKTMKGLIALHVTYPDSVIIPSFNRRRGHPTLFPKGALQGTAAGSLRDVIDAHASTIVYLDTEDEGILLDMDTLQDYENILERYGKKEHLS